LSAGSPDNQSVEITPQIHGIDFQGRVWAYACLERDRITLIDSGVADRVDTALKSIRSRLRDRVLWARAPAPKEASLAFRREAERLSRT